MNYRIHKSAKLINSKGIDIQSQNNDDPNHFDPRYFGKGKKYHQPKKYVIENTIKDLSYIADKTSNQETSCTTVDLDPLPLTSPARTADISFPSRVNTKVSKVPLLLPASFGKIILTSPTSGNVDLINSINSLADMLFTLATLGSDFVPAPTFLVATSLL